MAIYKPLKNLPVGSWKGQNALPVDRPVDWPTVIFLTVEPPVDRQVDRPQPRLGCFQSVDRLVDRPSLAGL